MIQLYHNKNTNFDKNGDIILLPDMCEVTAGINRTWQLDIHHPIDEDGRWKGIVNNAVIKAPSFKPYGTQLWRIVQTEKSDSGITATCDPICYDAAQEVFFIEKSLNNLTAQNALNSICQGTRYTAYSNVEGRHTTRYYMANLIEIVQSHENGIQKTWGGEVGFNNYEIQLFEHIGGEPGTVISYGKNIAIDGLTESVNIDGVITRLIPEGYSGRLMDGTPWVDSPNINKYATVRIGTVNYDHLRLKGDPEGDETKDGIYFDTKEELDAALREAALQEFAAGLDRPKVNLEIDVVLLENTREYAEYKNVDDLTLGDEVICRHQRLDVDTQSRVIQVRFDCIKEKIVYVEIGDRKRNYFDNVSSTVEAVNRAITPSGDVIASQIDGFINGAKAQLRLQNTVTKKQEAIAILFEDTDPDSETFGALALGTQGLQLSRTRQNNEWVWGTAITSEGVIANYIVAGILSDKNAFNYWNLDTGEFRLSSTATVGGQTVQQIASSAANAAVDAQTQEDIFNKLTNNGALQGIYMSDGQLYVNGTYIKAGVIDANLIKAGIIKDTQNKNYWNLATGEFSLSSSTTVGGSTVQNIADTSSAAAGASALASAKTYADQVAAAEVAAQTQQDIFNKLTNNGALQGIYMQNGELYVNGTYIKTGTIDANLVKAGIIKDAANKNSWNLTTGALSTSGAVVSGGSITGATINNGSGTFRVDAAGNLTATSASISGNITGSTITGSTITGSTITSTDNDNTTTMQAGVVTTDYTSAAGARYQSRLGSTGFYVDYTPEEGATGTVNTRASITNTVMVRKPDTSEYALMQADSIKVQDNSSNYSSMEPTLIKAGGNNARILAQRDASNFTRITADNIEIYVGGTRVWSAR